MTRLELRRHNGQWDNRGVLERIRRKIEAQVAMGECVLIDTDGVVGLSEEQFRQLVHGLPEDKVRAVDISFGHPFQDSP